MRASRHERQAGSAAAGTSTVRIQYGYDRDDNALFRHDLVFEALDDLYQYDGLNRLTSYKRGVLSKSTAGGPYDTVASPYNQQSWTLDAQGNWGGFTADGSTTAKTFDQANQVASVDGSTTGIPTYDADGNTTAKDGRSYVYDAWNRLVAVKSGATTLASYAYDALRRRIKEAAGSATTDVYFTAGSQPIEERAGGTAAADVSYQYVYGATGQIVLRDAYSGGTLQAASRLYAQQDANGDVVALVGGATATAGDPQERYWYTPYGAVGVLAGGGAGRPSGTAYGWRNYFQGGRLDAATGLYVFGLRDYDQATGVWMERDPIGLDAGDPNLYRFVGNNPINFVDPSGEAIKREWVIPGRGWKYGIDRGPEIFGGFEIHVYRNDKEVVKLNHHRLEAGGFDSRLKPDFWFRVTRHPLGSRRLLCSDPASGCTR